MKKLRPQRSRQRSHQTRMETRLERKETREMPRVRTAAAALVRPRLGPAWLS
jgi:hypothetical protein